MPFVLPPEARQRPRASCQAFPDTAGRRKQAPRAISDDLGQSVLTGLCGALHLPADGTGLGRAGL